MLTRRRILAGLVALTALAVAAPTLAGRRDSKPAHEQALGQLINNVRYGQDNTALTFLDGPLQGPVLLGDAWGKGTAEQQAEFIKLFHHLFAAVAFPKMRDSFQHLTTVTYDAPKAAGDRIEVGSVLHIQAGPKEQELKLVYSLSKAADGALKVVDVTIVGEASMLASIRDDQITPIMAEGGWPKLLELLRARAKDLPAIVDQPLKK
ncbi:MAG: ABC transporter substrate-binding protein [Myxococcales bacterium]|nr:ABC transporter substrate-binding protein [Myxococcales bacterium]